MRIGIDIDGVINNLWKFHFERGTEFCRKHQITTEVRPEAYRAKEMFQWSDELYRMFQSEYYPEFFLTTTYVHPFAAQVIHDLHRHHQIFIITARKDHLTQILGLPPETSVSALSRPWLAQANIEYDGFLLDQLNKYKAMEETRIDLMIEDSPEFFACGSTPPFTQLCCFDAPYNRTGIDGNIPRVQSWLDIPKFIQKGGRN